MTYFVFKIIYEPTNYGLTNLGRDSDRALIQLVCKKSLMRFVFGMATVIPQ